jgi:hypothetical protein
MKQNVLLKVLFLVALFSTLAFSSPAFEGQESNPFLGAWTGSLSVAGVTLDFMLTFSLDVKSQMTGTIDVPAQGAAGIRLGKIKTEGNKISFMIDDPGAAGDPTFKGELDGTGKKIAGSFTQSGYEGTFTMEKRRDN